MTDILHRLAVLTGKLSDPLLPCPFCGGNAFCTEHEEECCCVNPVCKISKTPFSVKTWNIRPRETALIALVQEAAGEIARLRGALEEISKQQEYGGYGTGLGYTQGARIAQKALNPQESAPC